MLLGAAAAAGVALVPVFGDAFLVVVVAVVAVDVDRGFATAVTFAAELDGVALSPSMAVMPSAAATLSAATTLRARWAGCTRFRAGWDGRSAYGLKSLIVVPFGIVGHSLAEQVECYLWCTARFPGKRETRRVAFTCFSQSQHSPPQEWPLKLRA